MKNKWKIFLRTSGADARHFVFAINKAVNLQANIT
jgi:hypothetical protein